MVNAAHAIIIQGTESSLAQIYISMSWNFIFGVYMLNLNKIHIANWGNNCALFLSDKNCTIWMHLNSNFLKICNIRNNYVLKISKK